MRARTAAIVAAAVLAAAGCAQENGLVKTYRQIQVGTTTRRQVDRILGKEPVRPGAVEVFTAPEGDDYLRLRYARDAADGVVVEKHLFSWSDRKGDLYRHIALRRLGEVRPKDPAPYRRAIGRKDITPLIDLLAPEAATLAALLIETPYARPEFGTLVTIRAEFLPEPPPPPEGQRHLPETFVFTRRRSVDDFDQSHRGFGRFSLLTASGETFSVFFVPALIFPGSRSYSEATIDKAGWLTFRYHFENYGEKVDTLVAVKEEPAGVFRVRYETEAALLLRP